MVKNVICKAMLFCLLMAVCAVTVMAEAGFVHGAVKKANPLKVSGKTVRLEEDELQKKAQTISAHQSGFSQSALTHVITTQIKN